MRDKNLNLNGNSVNVNEFCCSLHLNHIRDDLNQFIIRKSIYHFESYINKPTREQNTSATCIDHILFFKFNINRSHVTGVIKTTIRIIT